MTANSIFTDFGLDFLNSDFEKNPQPFKNHPQIPFLIDTLSRHERHHVALISQQSNKIHQAFIKAAAEHLSTELMPKPLRNCQFIYFDAIRFATAHISKEKIAQDFQTLVAQLQKNDQRIIFAINQLDFLSVVEPNFSISYFTHLINQILTHDNWRVILFISEKNALKKLQISHLFSLTHLAEPLTDHVLALLKNHKAALEDFHQTIISDEVAANAFTLATQYLPGHSHFDKTLELLDSAAARASLINHTDHSEQKSLVTSHFLMQVIANATRIPVSYLQNNKFQAPQFIEIIRKKIFGQDAAISVIASLLQNACIKLHDASGTLCNFLLVGSHDVGKTDITYAMSEHLFGTHDAVLQVNLNFMRYTSLHEIKIFPRDKNPEISLLAAIQQMPYAIVLIENIEQVPHETLYLIKGIFDQGYLVDEEYNKYDFRQALIIATTRTTSEQISNATMSYHHHDHGKSIDLMQLVLNEPMHDSLQQNISDLSPHELCDELMPKLIEHLPQAILEKFNVIPFVPLDFAAFEKIIRTKIKVLARRLHNSFGIELSFAPEVIKFLAHEALWRKTQTKSLDKLLEQHLYSTVTHEILVNADNKNRSKRLLIQLNESGQLLRCEFITSNEATFYSF